MLILIILFFSLFCEVRWDSEHGGPWCLGSHVVWVPQDSRFLLVLPAGLRMAGHPQGSVLALPGSPAWKPA